MQSCWAITVSCCLHYPRPQRSLYHLWILVRCIVTSAALVGSTDSASVITSLHRLSHRRLPFFPSNDTYLKALRWTWGWGNSVMAASTLNIVTLPDLFLFFPLIPSTLHVWFFFVYLIEVTPILRNKHTLGHLFLESLFNTTFIFISHPRPQLPTIIHSITLDMTSLTIITPIIYSITPIYGPTALLSSCLDVLVSSCPGIPGPW